MSNLKICRDLNKLHPFVKHQAEKVLEDCRKAGLNVDYFETIRTLERQKYLKTSLKSTTLNSYHRLGLAVDFVFFTSAGNWTWNRPDNDWTKLANIMEFYGFTAGWHWKRFKDGPHAQIDFEGIISTSLYKKLNELDNNLEFFYKYVDSLLKKDRSLKVFYTQYLKEITPKKEPEAVQELDVENEKTQEVLPKRGILMTLFIFLLSFFGIGGKNE